MMWTRKRAAIAGFALIALTNAVALSGVAYNRSGEPRNVIELSSRELHIPTRYYEKFENSGIALRLEWRTTDERGYPQMKFGRSAVLDETKLRELGFDALPTEKAEDENFSDLRLQAKPVYVVLELDGSAYQQMLEQARAELRQAQAELDADPKDKYKQGRVGYAQDDLEREENKNSRLFMVDAGRAAEPLRVKYPDNTRYLILPGSVQPSWDYVQDESGERKGKIFWRGRIADLNGTEINVPLPESRQLRVAPDAKIKFTARVAYGQRFEPWLERLEVVPAQ